MASLWLSSIGNSSPRDSGCDGSGGVKDVHSLAVFLFLLSTSTTKSSSSAFQRQPMEGMRLHAQTRDGRNKVTAGTASYTNGT